MRQNAGQNAGMDALIERFVLMVIGKEPITQEGALEILSGIHKLGVEEGFRSAEREINRLEEIVRQQDGILTMGNLPA